MSEKAKVKSKKTAQQISPTEDQTTWKEAPVLYIKGFLMGSADVVPGVSGGTMALITGIYERLIFAVKSVDTDLLKAILTFKPADILRTFHWRFLLVLITGVLTAVFFFTNIVPLQIYMHTHPEVVYGLFFGLIAGSIRILFKDVDSRGKKVSLSIAFTAGALFGFWIVNLVPTATPNTFLYVFLSGMIAFCAMILPGISGSYLLLILGKYDYVLGQFAGFGDDFAASFLALLPLFIGGATGILLFSRVLSWLLRRYHAVTMMVLIGFLVGSLYVIWPYQERTYQEIVSEIELVDANGPLAQELRSNPSPEVGPEYRELGDVSTVQDNGTESVMVEIRTVSRKLVQSDPYLPLFTQHEELSDTGLWQGIIGMAAGFILVLGVDRLRGTDPQTSH